LLRLVQVNGALVHGCVAPEGTSVFLQAEGEDTRRIMVTGNDLSGVGRAVALEKGAREKVIHQAGLRSG
jgi:hypothetical protein